MIEQAAARGLNHLLQTHPWALQRLRPFAGKCVRLHLPPLPDLNLRILESGTVEALKSEPASDLTVTVKPGALQHLILRDSQALGDIELAGPADLANAVQDLYRNLEWDFEEDLSKILGDVAAHRVAATGRDLLAWQKEAALRLAQNFAEYWTEERPVIARFADVAAFRRDVDALSADCEKLSKRIERIEAKNP